MRYVRMTKDKRKKFMGEYTKKIHLNDPHMVAMNIICKLIELFHRVIFTS